MEVPSCRQATWRLRLHARTSTTQSLAFHLRVKLLCGMQVVFQKIKNSWLFVRGGRFSGPLDVGLAVRSLHCGLKTCHLKYAGLCFQLRLSPSQQTFIWTRRVTGMRCRNCPVIRVMPLELASSFNSLHATPISFNVRNLICIAGIYND